MLSDLFDSRRGDSWRALRLSVAVGVVLGGPLLVHSASAESAAASNEPKVATFQGFAVSRRAPRETWLRSAPPPPRRPIPWAHFETVSRTSPEDRLGDSSGFKIAGISIAPKCTVTTSQKTPNDRLSEGGLKARWNEGRNATSGGLSLDAVSGIGWLVGALGVGVGTYLLVTSDKSKGHETTIGPDFYGKGAGLRVRRRW